jgi:hypothetical protein
MVNTIMMTLYVLLVLLRFTWCHKVWEPCGEPSGCFCTTPVLGEILCDYIQTFPVFDTLRLPGVLSVTIRESNLTHLDPFSKRHWDRLSHLHLIDTPKLPCATIDGLKRPGLHVLCDRSCYPPCNMTSTGSCPPDCNMTVTTNPCPTGSHHYEVLLGALSFIITVGVIMEMYLRRPWAPNTRVSPMVSPRPRVYT